MEETITIFKVGTETEEAVKNIQDLKDNIKILKDNLSDLNIGEAEYQKTLKELQVNQNALKNAMYGTSSSMEDIVKSAKGVGQSYNSLVKQMADLKQQQKNVDLSTADGVKRYGELATQINEVNDRLKDLDAQNGNFQRNVGNYKSAFKGLADGIDAYGKGLKIAKGGVNDFKDVSEGLAKSPMIATFAILVSAVMKVADAMKENETAMNAVRKAMDGLKPIMDFLSGIVEKLAEYLADLITKVLTFVQDNGLIQKVINAVTGVGNAILKFIIAPIKGIVAVIKVFQEEGLAGFRDMGKAFADEMKNGVAFKSNYEAGQNIADAITSGFKDSKKTMTKEIGSTMKDSVKDAIKYALKDWKKELQKGIQNADAMDKLAKEALSVLDGINTEDLKAIESDLGGFFEDIYQKMADADKAEKDASEAKRNAMISYVSTSKSLLDSLATYYERDEESSAKNAEKIKALRIATATIDTISGAIGAYMSAVKSIPAPYGLAVGTAQASAVMAMGIANIAKIRSTSFTSASASTSSVSASVQAPTTSVNVEQVRSITSASDEEKLNTKSKVYLVTSELEMIQNSQKVSLAEASF